LIDGQVYVQEGHSLTEMIGADTVRETGVCPERIVDPATCEGALIGSVRAVYVGNASPDYNAGWSNEIRWKSLSVYGILERQKGGLLRSTTWAGYDTNGNSRDCDLSSPNPAQDTCQYRAAVGAKVSRVYLQDASYVKLRELALNWDMPGKMASALHLPARAMRLSLSGRNLKTWTKYRGGDPEFANFGGADALVQLQRNRELAPYPPSRQYWLSLQVDF
jgi:hypothetical protein